jgi:thioesterase domain-containing protein
MLTHPLDGDALALADVAAAITRYSVWALAPLPPDEAAKLPSMAALARRFVSAIRTVQPTGPYRLGGAAFGALIAVEAASQIVASGDVVERLLIIDQDATDDSWRARARARFGPGNLPVGVGAYAMLRLHFLRHGRRLEAPLAMFVELDPESRMREVRRLLQQVKQAPLPPDGEISIAIQNSRANFNAMLGFEPPRLTWPTTVLRAADGHPEDHERPQGLRWEPFVDRLDLRVVPGNHFTVAVAPHATTLARTIDDVLSAP